MILYLLFVLVSLVADISFCCFFAGASKPGAPHVFTAQSLWVRGPPGGEVSVRVLSGRGLQTAGPGSLHPLLPGSDHRTSHALQGKAAQPCLKHVLVWGEVECWCSSRCRILANNVRGFLFFLLCPCFLTLSHSILKQMTQNSINPKCASYWTMMWVRWTWSLLKRNIAKQDSWRRWGKQFLKMGRFNP